jgi:hypothetical protein
MKITKIVARLIFMFPFIALNAMEEDYRPLAKLPDELQLHIAQFLGKDLKELVRNSIILSKTNRHFHDLLANPTTMRRLINHTLGHRAIAQEFLAMIFCNQNLDQIKNFVEFFMLPEEDLPAMNKENPEWLTQIFACWARAARGCTQKFDLEVPEWAELQIRFYIDLLTYLVDKHIIDANAEYNRKTPLMVAIELGQPWPFSLLMNHGAELNNPLNKEAIDSVKGKKMLEAYWKMHYQQSKESGNIH